jgi:isoamylase
MDKFNGQILPGKPYPLGATWDGKGINFALYSEHAAAVKLCLFKKADDSEEYTQINLTETTGFVWHAYFPGLKPGQIYAYRVFGRYKPRDGFRYNPHKLLIDPYAKAICGRLQVTEKMLGFNPDSSDKRYPFKKDIRDSASDVSKCIVIDPWFNWEGDERPDIPMHDSIIYELHVKGFTAAHPGIPKNERGTYKALSSPIIIDYFKKLGITAIELMPVHHFAHDWFLVKKDLINYWGYNSIGFFAPHAEYTTSGLTGQQVFEFKEMVKAYHRVGIEIILDVVYNHTGEGSHLGPTICFRGIDNQNYYRLDQDNKDRYKDYTGTGNTLNLLNAQTLQMVMDSLRYWVTEMHVDGFRFDLASALARGLYDVGKLSTFLDTIHQDPVISQVKLIAEPWDLGEGGYQVGNFPVLWAEWNGKFRDCVRRFWRGDESQVKELAYRLSGSSDLYEDDGRLPSASINFITCHDGFTLHDLVSYNQKHNAANKEDNKDGESQNLSWNTGVEGATGNPEIIALREKRKRSFMATLLLSQGVPMISHGDEYGRTQQGNNNVYCQDNELSWFNWQWDDMQKDFFKFTQRVIELRKNQPVLHRRRFFKGRRIRGTGVRDIRWLNTEGIDMTDEQWNVSFIRCMGMLLNGEHINEVDECGEAVKDDILLLIVNSFWEEIDFTLPNTELSLNWEVLVDTNNEKIIENRRELAGKISVPDRSLLLLRNLR